MMFKHYGLDHYKIHLKEILFLKKCQNHNIYVYHLKEVEGITFFSARLKDRKRVQGIFANATLLYTSGLVGMLFRNFTNKTRVVSYILCMMIWMFLSATVFQIEVVGPKDFIDAKISETLKPYLYQKKDVQKMKEVLLKTYTKDVSWLEVYAKGSVVKVRYAAKEKITSIHSNNAPLIAKKDGMIAYFKSDAGFKVRKVNEVVKKGDILVDNHMPDSFNKEVSVDVRGQVYAYTWQKVIVEMEDNKIPEAIHYFSLLFEARNQIHIDLKNEEKVVKENVLQFSKNQGKMKLEILYTLLEDITS